MKLEQSFEVAAPIDQVWDALIDVERVAPCLPGASVTRRNEDGSYTGALTIKIGPTKAAYAGKLEMENIDESTRSATMQAHGTDKRGQGGAKATISSTLSPVDGGTHVEVVTDYHISGRLARFGRGGMIEDISERLLREFAQCLQSSLVGGQGAGAEAEAAAAGPAGADAAAVGVDAAAADAAAAGGSEAGDAASNGDGPVPPQESAPQESAPQESAPQRSEPQQGAPLDAVPLVAGVARDRAKENPTPIAAILLGFLLAVIILRRLSRHSAD